MTASDASVPGMRVTPVKGLGTFWPSASCAAGPVTGEGVSEGRKQCAWYSFPSTPVAGFPSRSNHNPWYAVAARATCVKSSRGVTTSATLTVMVSPGATRGPRGWLPAAHGAYVRCGPGATVTGIWLCAKALHAGRRFAFAAPRGYLL
jgi:hypothetical protein